MDTRKPIRRFWLICLAVAATAGLAGTAQAQDQHKVIVHYSDLNISTVAGATTLYHRIRGAARFVCGDEGRAIDDQLMWEACFRATVADAVTAVHSPLLSTLDAGTSGRTATTVQLRK